MTIRTYKPRRGRVTPRQARALEQSDGLLLPVADAPVDLVALFADRPVILEIGFGTGRATAQMAADDPGTGILAVDVHTPGVGDLLHRIREGELHNVRVIEGDALTVLQSMVTTGSLAGVRTYFPDPWPKARHHKRRIVTPANASLIADRVRVGGTWDLATDWPPYAEAMIEALQTHPHWSGGVVPRPSWRPITRYEQTALDQGRFIIDLQFTRVDATVT